MQVNINVDNKLTLQQLASLSKMIMWSLPSAINTSLRDVQDLIYSDYRRFGDASPSYLNSSRSGLGFTDRTGSLRASISYRTEQTSSRVKGTLSASMDYAKYVELLWGGKYSFLLPAFVQSESRIFDNITLAVAEGIGRVQR